MTKQTGGHAFPAMHFDLTEHEHGMTLRDYFAAKAMQGLVNDLATKLIAVRAYEIADAMLEARK